MVYLRVLVLTVYFKTKQLFLKAFKETQPAVIAYHSYTRREKYSDFFSFFWNEKIVSFFFAIEERLKFPGLKVNSDLNVLANHFKVKVYQSGFQIFILVFYFWLGKIFPYFLVEVIAVAFFFFILLNLMAHKVGWLTTVFHMLFYIFFLKHLFFYLNLYQICGIIFLYNFFFRNFIEASLELLIQPLVKFNVIRFIYLYVIKKINKRFY